MLQTFLPLVVMDKDRTVLFVCLHGSAKSRIAAERGMDLLHARPGQRRRFLNGFAFLGINQQFGGRQGRCVQGKGEKDEAKSAMGQVTKAAASVVRAR